MSGFDSEAPLAEKFEASFAERPVVLGVWAFLERGWWSMIGLGFARLYLQGVVSARKKSATGDVSIGNDKVIGVVLVFQDEKVKVRLLHPTVGRSWP